MKSQKIGLTALITLLTTVLAPFAPNSLALSPIPAALSQSTLYSGDGYQICRLRSQAMLPSMEYNNQVMINQLAYRSKLPRRGDIIVFRPNNSMLQEYILSEPAYPVNLSGTYLIRRVIGLPGETVLVAGGNVYINRQLLVERYTKDKPTYIFRQVTVPYNSYFVLGDSRNNSSDSHTWGFVTRDLIVGQFVRVVGQRAQLKPTRLVGQTQLKSELAQTSTGAVCRLY